MKKSITVWLILLLVLASFSSQLLPVLGSENIYDKQSPKLDCEVRTSRGSARQSLYTAYYNKTFSIDKSWESDNISIIAFVQTTDQTQKNKESGGSSGTFSSAEVLQSTINFLDGKQVRTACCRRVLFELITATWCGNCPAADGAFDRISRDSSLFPGKLTLVEIHPSSSGDYYNADSLARHNWYNHGNSHPTAIFDGLYCRTGGGSNPNNTNIDNIYRAIINKRQPTLPVIDLITFGNKTDTSGWINLTIELLSPTPVRNLKVQFMVVEDVYPAKSSHDVILRYTMRDMLIPDDFNPPNHPPEIKSTLPDVEIVEDNFDSSTIQLAPAFEDEDLDLLVFSSNRDGSSKQNIEVEIDETGNVTFTPETNWNGAEDITFYADDGRADPVEQTITVTVTGVNDAPVVAHPMLDFTMHEDIPINDKYNLSYVFYDVDLDPVQNAIPQEPLDFSYSGDVNIDVSISNDWVSFDPKPNWNGNETITFIVEDSESETATDDVRISVHSDNDPPMLKKALPKVSLDEDESNEDFIDLNDYFIDNDGDSLTYQVVEPKNIDVKLNYKRNSVLVSIYPDSNFWGTETISFSATDISGSEPVVGVMEVIVNSINDQPILNETDNWNIMSSSVSFNERIITILEDDPVELYVTAYDPADNDKLTFSDDTTLFEIDSNTGKIAFTPINDQVGSYNIGITVDDGGTKDNTVSDSFTFIVENVNDPPEDPQILKPVDGKTYTENTLIEFKGICDDDDLEIMDSDESLFYEWSTDQGEKSLSFDSEFSTTLKPGKYAITLVIRDSTGAMSSSEISITVEIDKNLDTDSDGTPNYLDDDDDGDGMPDEWENKYSQHLDPLDSSDAKSDPDKDDYNNLQEYLGDDGEPGGDDSTNPTRKSSHPGSDSIGDGDGKHGTSSGGYLIVAIVGVIIVVLVLLLLLFIKKRKKPEASEKNSPTEIEPHLTSKPTQEQPIHQEQIPHQQIPQQQIPQQQIPQQQIPQQQMPQQQIPQQQIPQQQMPQQQIPQEQMYQQQIPQQQIPQQPPINPGPYQQIPDPMMQPQFFQHPPTQQPNNETKQPNQDIDNNE
jgi:VCBS repeat-containing protein